MDLRGGCFETKLIYKDLAIRGSKAVLQTTRKLNASILESMAGASKFLQKTVNDSYYFVLLPTRPRVFLPLVSASSFSNIYYLLSSCLNSYIM